MLRRTSFLPLLIVAACSQEKAQPMVLAPPPPGLAAEPRWLTFTCVEPGCDSMLSTSIKVIGERDLAIKRIVLSDRDRTDFTLEPGKTPPFILKTSETFTIDARFQPDGDPRLGDVDVLITYTDASASESEERVEAGELKIPLVRRLIGEPAMAVSPDALVFGAVLPGARKELPLTIRNEGFGNVGLVIEAISSDLPQISVTDLPEAAILPNESHDVTVVFAPIDEEYAEGFLSVRSADPLAPAAMVAIAGTSIPRATIAATPEDGVDFGEVPVRSSDRAALRITNRGTEPLTLSNIELVNASPSATIELDLPPGALTGTIAALGSIEVGLDLTAGSTPGEINSIVRLTSNDTRNPVLDVPVVGVVTEPNLSLSPVMLDFGRVPRGWSVPLPIELENTGYGDLVISNVTMVLGSSELFTLRTQPTLPVRLRHGQRLGLLVEFRSEAEASFNGSLSIESNDPDTPFIEIPLVALGASCLEGCPIANGTPSCTAGSCSIGMCNSGWYDTDSDPVTGCECQERGRDPGTFCAEAEYLGSLADDGARANFTGIVPTADDVDMVRFFAVDETQFLSDDFDVRVRLESSDPGIQFCIYRFNTGAHDNACILENESCPGNRSYRRDGSGGSDDSADFTIKVFRAPGSAPSCTSYTLFVSND